MPGHWTAEEIPFPFIWFDGLDVLIAHREPADVGPWQVSPVAGEIASGDLAGARGLISFLRPGPGETWSVFGEEPEP